VLCVLKALSICDDCEVRSEVEVMCWSVLSTSKDLHQAPTHTTHTTQNKLEPETSCYLVHDVHNKSHLVPETNNLEQLTEHCTHEE